MFRISRRKRLGTSVMASATRRSNLSLFILSHDHEAKIVAVVANGTLVAQRLRFADAAAVKNLHVGGERPHLLWQGRAQLFLDLHRVVTFGDADAIGDA